MEPTTQPKANVPALRFPEFEGEWERNKLSDLAFIYDGTHQTPKYTEKGIKFVSVENIENLDGSTKFISEKAFKKDFKIKPQKGDILMTRITAGIIGATAIVPNDDPLGYYVSLALIRTKVEVDFNFLSTLINSVQFKRELHKRIIHVAFPKKINLGDIGDCQAAIPSLPEQQKIASFLKTVEEKLQALKKKKSLLEQYKKGVMQKIFSQELRFTNAHGIEFPEWEEKQLGQVATINTGSSNRIDSNLNGVYTFFDRSQDIRTSNIFLFDGEAIIVAGEGQEFIPKYFIGKFDLHQRTYAIMNFKHNNGKYLYYFIFYYRSYFYSQAVGSTVKSLRLPIFQNMEVKLPCKEEQTKIANFLSALDVKISSAQVQIKKTEQYKKGLLQKMFV